MRDEQRAEAEIVSLASLRSQAVALRDSLWSAPGVKGDSYEVGFIRFLPTDRTGGSLIRHADRDVVCFVLQGTGWLEHGSSRTPLKEGDLCRIPVGTPHSFFAAGEALEMLYATIRVATAGS